MAWLHWKATFVPLNMLLWPTKWLCTYNYEFQVRCRCWVWQLNQIVMTFYLKLPLSCDSYCYKPRANKITFPLAQKKFYSNIQTCLHTLISIHLPSSHTVSNSHKGMVTCNPDFMLDWNWGIFYKHVPVESKQQRREMLPSCLGTPICLL